MGRYTKAKLLKAFASSLSIAAAAPAIAQSASTDPAQPPSGTLEDIVVTADRTSSNLQRTPIAITALSPEQLQRADIRSVVDLAGQVPGVAIQTGGAFPLNVTIRGVGYDGLQNNSAQPGVAFVQNGVYIASPLNLSASFLDISRLEVLRGPQGTVNGQNADGGAINLTTGLAAIGAFQVDGEISYGSYDYNRMRAIVNLPVGDTLAIRFAAQHEGHEGWLLAPSHPTEDRLGSEDAWMGRASLAWQPTERLSVTLWGEYFDRDANGIGVRNILDPIGDVRATSNDTVMPQSTRSRIGAATIAYNFDFATLTAIGSYQTVSVDAPTSGDLMSRANALAIYGVKDEEPVYRRAADSYTGEISLSHSGGRLNWIIGGFFLRTDENQRIYETQQTSAAPIPVTPTFDPDPAQIGVLFGQGLAFVSRAMAQRTSLAAFGQATLHLGERIRITGGLRYSDDQYDSDTSVFFHPPVPLESDFSVLTGKAVVEYDLAPRSTLYASFSTGVKPGGTNLNPDALIVPTGFRHEFVRAYELGLKSELFDRTLRLNLSAFYNDYRNLQTGSEDPIPFSGGITNVPKSHIYGIDAEASLLLPAGFRIDANMALMDSRVDSHFAMLDPQDAFRIDRANGGPFMGNSINDRFAAFQDVFGNELARVPRFSASGSISKTTTIGNGQLDLFLQANYRSGYQARVFNDPVVDDVGSLFTMNVNARYAPVGGPWYVELQVTNLTGSDDVASRFPDNFEVGAVYDFITPPRQVIGRVGIRF